MDGFTDFLGGIAGRILGGLNDNDTRKTYKGVASALGLGASVVKSIDTNADGWDDAGADAMEVLAHFFGHLADGNVSKVQAYGHTAKEAIDKIVVWAEKANVDPGS